MNDNDNRFHTESALKSTGFLPKDADLGGGGLELGSSYSLYSPRISAFFAVANEMLTELYEITFCLGTSSAVFLPRLAGLYIKILNIYLGNLGKNIDEK